jgi:hypothetical protein
MGKIAVWKNVKNGTEGESDYDEYLRCQKKPGFAGCFKLLQVKDGNIPVPPEAIEPFAGTLNGEEEAISQADDAKAVSEEIGSDEKTTNKRKVKSANDSQ